MTNDEKIARVIEDITERHIDWHGGYPYDYAWIGKTLWVAELDPGKEYNRTLLCKYTRASLLKRYDEEFAET